MYYCSTALLVVEHYKRTFLRMSHDQNMAEIFEIETPKRKAFSVSPGTVLCSCKWQNTEIVTRLKGAVVLYTVRRLK